MLSLFADLTPGSPEEHHRDARYNPQALEPKWQAHWQQTHLDQALDPPGFQPKFYALFMFHLPCLEDVSLHGLR